MKNMFLRIKLSKLVFNFIDNITNFKIKNGEKS